MKKFTILFSLVAMHLCTTTQAQTNVFPPNGNVGIGTNNPQQKLHVESGGNIAMFVSTTPLNSSPGSGMIGYTQHLPTASGQRLGFFLLGSRGGGNQYYHGVGMAGYAQGAWNATSWPAYLTFETTPSGSNTRVERLRVAADGNVGIGTTFPNTVLHVNSAAGQDPFRVQVSGGTKLYVDANGGVAVGGLATPPSSGLYVVGNAGVGTTAPAAKLHVAGGTDASLAGGGFIISGSTSGTNIVLDDNEIIARTNGVASTLFLNNNGGNLIYNGANVAGARFGINTSAPVSDISLVHTNGFISNGLTLKNSFSTGLSWNIYSATTDDLWFSNDGTLRGTIDGTSGAYTAVSDKRVKKDVDPMEDVIERVMKLKPKLYRFTKQSEANSRKFMGMIAQEVQPLFPEAIYEHKGKNDGLEDLLTLDYSTFGIIAIKAIQEQQQQIEQQQQQIEELKAMVNKLANGQTVSPLTGGGTLLQNTPNPGKGTTTIQYSLPEGAGRAQLLMTDALGRMIKTVQLTTSGVVNMDISTLSSGVYNYSLVVDGNILQTKRMTVTR